jgi:hypothetical protein
VQLGNGWPQVWNSLGRIGNRWPQVRERLGAKSNKGVLNDYASVPEQSPLRGMNGHYADMAAKGQMRVSRKRELDNALSTDYQPVQKFQGEKKLKSGEIVPVEIALLLSSTLFRKGESLSLTIQGYSAGDHPLLFYDWLINKGRHVIYTGDKYDSYLQIPVIQH